MGGGEGRGGEGAGADDAGVSAISLLEFWWQGTPCIGRRAASAPARGSCVRARVGRSRAASTSSGPNGRSDFSDSRESRRVEPGRADLRRARQGAHARGASSGEARSVLNEKRRTEAGEGVVVGAGEASETAPFERKARVLTPAAHTVQGGFSRETSRDWVVVPSDLDFDELAVGVAGGAAGRGPCAIASSTRLRLRSTVGREQMELASQMSRIFLVLAWGGKRAEGRA